MFKMPPASPVTYSKAIKGLRKETIHVNDNVYPVGQRSLDRAMQVVPVRASACGSASVAVSVWVTLCGTLPGCQRLSLRVPLPVRQWFSIWLPMPAPQCLLMGVSSQLIVVLQDLKSCLARELEVSEEEAGEMASTVVHRSNQVLPTTRRSCRAMYLTNVSLVAAAHYG